MKNNKNKERHFISWFPSCCKKIFFLLPFIMLVLTGQGIICSGADHIDSNEELLNQYVLSKGQNIISFDASNIKQFWIEKSVVSRNNSIQILLKGNKLESEPLKIQLANVNEAQDCRIEVVSNSDDFSFSVLNNQSTAIATSQNNTSFLDYSIASSSFHLEDTTNLSFALKFQSKSLQSLSLKRIIFSFSDNKKSIFLQHPGELIISAENSYTNQGKDTLNEQKEFIVSGRLSRILSKNRIYTSSNELRTSVKVKNIGESATRIYIGFAPFNKHGEQISNRSIPYKDNNDVLKVISIDKNSIIVDSYSAWEKGCSVALNAKKDSSDFPNCYFLSGKVQDIKKNQNDNYEITLDKPVDSNVIPGTLIRIHSLPGETYLYLQIAVLMPGEEKEFVSTIKKDDNNTHFTSESFCKGTYYVQPIILSYSVDSKETNTIQISDYSIAY